MLLVLAIKMYLPKYISSAYLCIHTNSFLLIFILFCFGHVSWCIFVFLYYWSPCFAFWVKWMRRQSYNLWLVNPLPLSLVNHTPPMMTKFDFPWTEDTSRYNLSLRLWKKTSFRYLRDNFPLLQVKEGGIYYFCKE